MAALWVASQSSALQPGRCSIFVETDSDASRAVSRALREEYGGAFVACDEGDFSRDECYAPLRWRSSEAAAVAGRASYGVRDVWPYDACDMFAIVDDAGDEEAFAFDTSRRRSMAKRAPTPEAVSAKAARVRQWREERRQRRGPRRGGGRELRSAGSPVDAGRFACAASASALAAAWACFDARVPLPSGASWRGVLEPFVVSASSSADQAGVSASAAGGGAVAARLVPPPLDGNSVACPAAPHPGGYLWLHSWGYAPQEPIQGEGLNGWRITLARVAALAKRTNASVVLPCARHSILVPCALRGPLAGLPELDGLFLVDARARISLWVSPALSRLQSSQQQLLWLQSWSWRTPTSSPSAAWPRACRAVWPSR